MAAAEVVRLIPGARFWLDGEAWAVQSITGQRVTLSSGSRAMFVAVADLVERARSLDATSALEDPAVLVLSQLTASGRRQLEQRLAHVRSVLSADGTLETRLAGAAQQAGISARTLERWISAYRQRGPAGLVDATVVRARASRVDPRWDAACLAVLRRHTAASTLTRGAIIDEVEAELIALHGDGTVRTPHRATAYRRLQDLSKGKHSFGSAKARRSVANRPEGPYGRLRATRPGEYVVLDTTPLDVFAMEPVTLRWVPVELTVAQDLYTRCILGLRLTPVSTTSRDVANVLYQSVRPDASRPSGEVWPFHGVPGHLLVGGEESSGTPGRLGEGLPAALPEAIVVDHGRQYLSAHILSACARLGITVQPAIPRKPTDKPTVERFFRTLREGLLQHLPAYKGPDVFSRGKDVEGAAFFYVGELEQVIREWVGRVYHRSKHDGLCVPEIPGAVFSPAEMFEIGVARAGGLLLPSRPDLAYEFLDVAWRTIQHYGVEVNGQRYDGPALNLYRNVRSPYGGAHLGKWPIFVDVHDVRYVAFQDPDTKAWHRLGWEHAPGLGQPFSQEASDYAKRVAVREQRHVDPAQAVRDLLGQWSRAEVTSRRDRSLARRLSASRAGPDQGATGDEPDAARLVSSLPGVVDLLDRRESKTAGLQVVDDVDVFERYYAAHPDAAGLEVFDE